MLSTGDSLLSDKISENLAKIIILADGRLAFPARRALLQYSDTSLVDSIREIFLNICNANLKIPEGK